MAGRPTRFGVVKLTPLAHALLDAPFDNGRVQPHSRFELDSYTPDVAMSDRIKVYTRVGLDLGKLYFVPGVLFIGGACLVFGGHRIMLQRNATLALAFTGLKKSFDFYRQKSNQVDNSP